MNANGKSDRLVVPEKRPNNGRGAPRKAEGVEERGRANGNLLQLARHRTQRRNLPEEVLLGWVRRAMTRATSPLPDRSCV